jgi:hypothetical protein
VLDALVCRGLASNLFHLPSFCGAAAAAAPREAKGASFRRKTVILGSHSTPFDLIEIS